MQYRTNASKKKVKFDRLRDNESESLNKEDE